jgi:hypothetical protein
MGVLWRQAGSGGSGYTSQSLDRLADSLAGRPLEAFIVRHVERGILLPVRECLSRVGLVGAIKDYAAEVFLVRDSAATEAASARRRSMFGPQR